MPPPLAYPCWSLPSPGLTYHISPRSDISSASICYIRPRSSLSGVSCLSSTPVPLWRRATRGSHPSSQHHRCLATHRPNTTAAPPPIAPAPPLPRHPGFQETTPRAAIGRPSITAQCRRLEGSFAAVGLSRPPCCPLRPVRPPACQAALTEDSSPPDCQPRSSPPLSSINGPRSGDRPRRSSIDGVALDCAMCNVQLSVWIATGGSGPVVSVSQNSAIRRVY